MELVDLIDPKHIGCQVPSTSKKRSLEVVSDLIAEPLPHLAATEVFDSLIARERLGSTGIGHGVAIPHGRIKGMDCPQGAVVQLEEPVDFDAVDGEPVDILFALLVPEESTDEHLQLLAQLAEMFSDRELCSRLRQAESAVAIDTLLRQWHEGSDSGGVAGEHA